MLCFEPSADFLFRFWLTRSFGETESFFLLLLFFGGLFNFKFGRKEYNGNFLQLGEEDILVIEGIHCLNDELSYSLPIDSKFKIYISALTQLNVDEHNRVSTTDGRLLRRLVRDYRTRGASAKKTLSMWESVRRGEEKKIV